MKEKVVVQLSGGLDSVAALAKVAKTHDVYPIFVDYGQSVMQQEFRAAYYASRLFYTRPIHVSRTQLALQQVGQNKDYIPVRNLVIAALSLNYALSVGARVVLTGSKTDAYREDDPWCWKDCTSEFHDKLSRLGSYLMEDGTSVAFRQPLRGESKADVVALLYSSGVFLRESSEERR